MGKHSSTSRTTRSSTSPPRPFEAISDEARAAWEYFHGARQSDGIAALLRVSRAIISTVHSQGDEPIGSSCHNGGDAFEPPSSSAAGVM